MADYYSVLQRAVAMLPENTGQARRAIYEKARTALVRQLESVNPPLPASEITKQRLALEEAVRRIEQETARSALNAPPAARPAAARPAAPKPATPPPAAPKAPPPAAIEAEPPPPPVRQPPRDVEPFVEPHVEDEGEAPAPDAAPGYADAAPPQPSYAPKSRPPEPAYSAAPPAAERSPYARAQTPPGRISAPSVDDGREDDDWIDSDHLPVDETPAAAKPAKSRRGLILAIVAILVVVLAGGAYVLRDHLGFGKTGTETASAPASETAPAGTSTPATTETQTPKIEDRLPTEQPAATPPAASADSTPAAPADSGTPAASETPAPSADSNQAAAPDSAPAPTETPAAPETAATDNAPAASEPVAEAPGPATATLFEEGVAPDSPGGQFPGQVTWAMTNESIGGGTPEPIVRAAIDVADRSMKVTLVFRKNRDAALPASHLIEVSFELGPKFTGGGIANVPGIIMKATATDRGDPLAGASARVSNGLFWIALSASAADAERNMTLLRTREWIDIPMQYANGKRAILTVRKGTTGDKAIDDALAAWAK